MEEPDHRPPFTREQLLDPANCADCHPKHFAEWSASMHAYATMDPVFRAMNQRGQEQLGDALGPFCLNCHAPMAVREGVISDYTRIDDIPKQLQGVTCYFCHNAIDPGPDHFNGKGIQLANDTTMRAGIHGAQFPSVHKVQYSRNHERLELDSSRLCGTCHDIVNQLNFPLEQTFSEYSQSFFSDATDSRFKSCQSCHMDLSKNPQLAARSSGYVGVLTTTRHVTEHLFPGVDVALTDFPGQDALRSAIEECQLRTSFLPPVIDALLPTSQFQVTFEAQVGHAEPSGATQDRRMWMEAVGTDDDGKVLYRGGQIAEGAVEEPPGTTHPCMLRDHTFDRDGNESHMFWDAASRDESRDARLPTPLQPSAGTHVRRCTFPAPGVNAIPNIELTMKVRPIGMDVLQDLVASGHLSPDVLANMPTFTIWKRRAHYQPDSNRYLVDEPDPPGDCDKYKCMLDPAGSCEDAAAAASGDASTADATR